MEVAPAAVAFSDGSACELHFASSGEKRCVDERGAQTEDIGSRCNATQTWLPTTIETQTESDRYAKTDPEALLAFDEWNERPPGMDDFLLRAGEAMLDELEQSDASQAFIGYVPFQEGEDNGISCYLTLSCDLSALQRGKDDGEDQASGWKPLHVTGVSWSATGSVIAASFGRNDIVGWCDTPGALATWNIFRRGFGNEEQHRPNMLLDHSSCLMCVSCHPVKPAVVAAGSFNGEIVVWDMSKGDPFVASTKIDDLFHREPITSVSWVFSAKHDDHRIAAVSGDGKLLFWSLDNGLQWPVEGYRIPAESGRVGKQEEGRASSSGARTVGCTAASFLKEGQHITTAVVGTEGGAVMKCRLAPSRKGAMDGSKRMHWSSEAEEIVCRIISRRDGNQVVRDVENFVRNNRGAEVDLSAIFRSRVAAARLYPAPNAFRMKGHHGPIHGLDSSPFHRSLILSCGPDGSGLLHNTLQSRALMAFEPSESNLMDIKWSRARPMVFSAVSEDGDIFVYDLLQSPVMPVASAKLPSAGLENSGSKSDLSSPFGMNLVTPSSLCFNPRQRNLLATGDSRGRVLIWRLSWRLANKQPGEEEGLQRLFKGHQGDSYS